MKTRRESLRPIGIIANPSSGKDIRRMVAFGAVFDNNEKINIVRRVLIVEAVEGKIPVGVVRFDIHPGLGNRSGDALFG